MKQNILGIDAVGNGALAGMIMAGAAVILKENEGVIKFLLSQGLNDSKKLSPKKRDYLESIINSLIIEKKISVGLYDNSSLLIDQIGIKQASLNAMHMATIRVLDSIGKPVSTQVRLNCTLMVDGIDAIPDINMKQITIIRGDQKIPEIMIASIIAKNNRDRLMVKLSKKYPQYGWEKNVGYGTAKHIKAIREFGLTPLHRKTFCQKFVR